MPLKDLNKDFTNNFSKSMKVYINTFGKAEERLLSAYRTTLDDIAKQIKTVYDKFGDNPSITEVRKFNRLVNIEKQISDKVRELNKSVLGITDNTIKTSMAEGFNGAVNSINKTFGFDFVSTTIDDESSKRFLSDTLWTDAMKNNNTQLWSEVKREFETVLRANAREEIISGIAQGKSYTQMIKDIQSKFELSKSRAKTIIFTEAHKAHSYARNEGINKAMELANEVGLKTAKVWRHNGVGEPRPDHLEADGLFADENGMFNVGGELLEAPGLGTDPSNNINCHCSAEFELVEDKKTEKVVEQLEKENIENTEQLKEVVEEIETPEPVKEVETPEESFEFNEDYILSEADFEDNLKDVINLENTGTYTNFNSMYKTAENDLNYKLESERFSGYIESLMKKGMKEDEINVINMYTGNAYKAMNSYFTKGKSYQSMLPEEITATKKIIDNLKHSLESYRSVVGNYKGTVQRITHTDFYTKRFSNKTIDKIFKEGDTYSWEGFASTGKRGSEYINKSLNINQMKFHIKGKTGLDVENISLLPREKEVLFQPGTKFKIIKVVKDNQVENAWHIFLEEI